MKTYVFSLFASMLFFFNAIVAQSNKLVSAEGKWKDYPGYVASKTGHIAIQDYGGEAWFKNIKIQRL